MHFAGQPRYATPQRRIAADPNDDLSPPIATNTAKTSNAKTSKTTTQVTTTQGTITRATTTHQATSITPLLSIVLSPTQSTSLSTNSTTFASTTSISITSTTSASSTTSITTYYSTVLVDTGEPAYTSAPTHPSKAVAVAGGLLLGLAGCVVLCTLVAFILRRQRTRRNLDAFEADSFTKLDDTYSRSPIAQTSHMLFGMHYGPHHDAPFIHRPASTQPFQYHPSYLNSARVLAMPNSVDSLLYSQPAPSPIAPSFQSLSNRSSIAGRSIEDDRIFANRAQSDHSHSELLKDRQVIGVRPSSVQSAARAGSSVAPIQAPQHAEIARSVDDLSDIPFSPVTPAFNTSPFSDRQSYGLVRATDFPSPPAAAAQTTSRADLPSSSTPWSLSPTPASPSLSSPPSLPEIRVERMSKFASELSSITGKE
ncbi:hypothetical protein D9758_014258 [Tetrapyrgos nigripes]|uniref:Uncharacterized protein n=1 Tax=Tetrapyrgos nigripes TaxID=182062 RepID=A0A8H5FIW4_9AGAR|nr:hypothetical protein D9758_014258 [Tetrapyrgos nigripes]